MYNKTKHICLLSPCKTKHICLYFLWQFQKRSANNMRNQKKLLIKQLDEKLKVFNAAEKIPVPQLGWINYIRNTLNMTLRQLGKRLNITEQGAKKIEEREISGAISINSLKEVSKALDMHFVYGFVPINGTVEKLVEVRARELARMIVLRTNQNMKLENQGNSAARIDQAIDELTSEIKSEMRRSIWD